MRVAYNLPARSVPYWPIPSPHLPWNTQTQFERVEMGLAHASTGRDPEHAVGRDGWAHPVLHPQASSPSEWGNTWPMSCLLDERETTRFAPTLCSHLSLN